jgi:hypothetical protein
VFKVFMAIVACPIASPACSGSFTRSTSASMTLRRVIVVSSSWAIRGN